jgi:hypothetical protein
VEGAVRPAIEVRGADGSPGLPEAVLSLVVPPEPGPGSVRFFNGSEAPARFAWRPEGEAPWNEEVLMPGEQSDTPG